MARADSKRANADGKGESRDDRDITTMSFEDALAELETIVNELEDGRIKLDAAISAYERGARLKAHCEKKLSEAKAKVEKISLGPSGPEGVEPADVG
ncbi:MAG: exodeoxyribonuclease VII small subunit [Alphaproteobacteria bacterium]|jgi:exodeoxyribonuclease VII small subunit|nr:exodeoxyribonuclease VII small subunit [Alphaproteobacteria bacterium]